MTKRREDGIGLRRTALDIQDVCLYQATLISLAFDALVTEPPNKSVALKALNELALKNIGLFDVHVSLADGALMDAETAAMRLAASRKGSV